jgi:hypothetical protein
LKNPSQKKAGGMAQAIGPEFKPQYHRGKKIITANKYCHLFSSISGRVTSIFFKKISG